MDVRFKDQALDRLETDPKFDAGLPSAVVKKFRQRMQQIRAVPDERDLYKLVSLRCEKLQGKRSHQHPMRLNDQWRLIFEFEGTGVHKQMVIISIEDYH